MRALDLLWGFVAAISLVVVTAQAAPAAQDTTFSVTRDGDKIGTTTLRVEHQGDQTIAQVATHVAVKLAFITVYRFDQSETEHWAGDRLVALKARTDDNGTVHHVEAKREGDALAVKADGEIRKLDPAVIPVSLWNPSLLRQKRALNVQDGKLTPVSVVDHGEERVVLDGRPMMAHHYSIKTNFPQDVWYDRQHRLIKVELHGSDGSTISYQPG